MARDDLAFAFILVGSVAFSALLRQFPAQLRPDAAAIVGAAAVVSACGPQCLHLAVALALAVFALNFAPPHYRERISFAIAFGHLAFVRLLPSPPGGPTNAAMLMLTLRLGAADATSTVELIRYGSVLFVRRVAGRDARAAAIADAACALAGATRCGERPRLLARGRDGAALSPRRRLRHRR